MRGSGHICVEGREGSYDAGANDHVDGLRVLLILRHLDQLGRVLKQEHSGVG